MISSIIKNYVSTTSKITPAIYEVKKPSGRRKISENVFQIVNFYRGHFIKTLIYYNLPTNHPLN
ncbi:hypothetical protein DFO77_11560 [Marinilabilia salmonicolor]|jgi:hypothetical protein|uniref:Uncharacterized protein n=1 Tax=Marinilabilia salmonicolor TaxID=989 RepID=A0A2T0XFW1_9BACT|nr:hypothetical protein BY457_11197 [Marinilabilia salmonicolor]RCW32515.1 hypothetical protein DFO77_11560 [Marinilabilia salmonicolor]